MDVSPNPIAEAINKALATRVDFYACRMPSDKNDEPPVFFAQTTDDFTSESGFRIAPFDSGKPQRVIFNEVPLVDFLRRKIDVKTGTPHPDTLRASTSWEEYRSEIDECLRLLASGRLQKIVLSKTIVCANKGIDWGTLFLNLANRYPNAFIFIFRTKETGAWMGASPEVLGSYRGGVFRTMALAGTKKAGSSTPWRQKEIEEQEYVVSFITGIFKRLRLRHDVSQSMTKNAGNVEHLCNLISARIPDAETAEAVIRTLHPTPALSGVPQKEAVEAIREIENRDRACYGGYLGPFSPRGFDYFVNLRSMRFTASAQELFCGGGITAASDPRQEWEETEEKAKTLLSMLP